MEEDCEYDALALKFPRRGRWYTRLWRSCPGFGCLRQKKTTKFPLYLIGYDPVGRLQRAACVGDVEKIESMIHECHHHVDESDWRGR